MPRFLNILTFGLALVTMGCAGAPIRANMRQLQSRAAYDLACPPQWMQIYHLDGSTKGVAGCGSRVTYVERCEAVGEGQCTWVLDMRVVHVPLPKPDADTARNEPRSEPSQQLGLDPLQDRR
jgi:hypothetical protein